MNFITVHDVDGLEVLVNLNQVEAILELPDGGCCFVFVCRMRMKKNRSFYSVETYKQVSRELRFFSGVPLLNFPLSEGRDIAKKVKCHINLPEDRIAGYCPNCDGTVDIKLTPLIKIKGHRCSWCGQAIDLSGVDRGEE